MIKKLFFTLLFLSFSISIKAQLFNQDFSGSTTIEDYISTAPNSGQFNEISTNGSNFTTSITNETLRFNRTGTGTMYAFRNISFETKPEFVQLKFDFEASNHQLNKNNVFAIFVGSTFTSASNGQSSNYASRFGISTRENQGEFRISTIDNIGGAPSSGTFSGKQTITFIVNSKETAQTYTTPNNLSENIASGKMDIWIGQTKVITGFSLKNTDSPKGAITGFKIQATSSTGTGTFDFDNIEMLDLLIESTQVTSGQSLVHPHIWVSPSDRQGILDNISNHTWANSLFNQLKQRQASRLTTHANNPSAEINLIPAIPGNRTTHRTRLNVGVECAMLYYLTEDERYAQIAADILHQYVKMLSTKDPLTFEFYAPNFNHLIPPRELFTRVAMIYDFVQPFISKSEKKVYDLNANIQIAFNFETSQKAFEVMADNVLKVGGSNSNHPVLELPGALYSVMCMEDDVTREIFFNKLWNGDAKQDGIIWMLDRFSDEDRLWPESAGYGKFTHALFIQIMNIVDRYKPDLNLVENNQDLLESIFTYENFLYPNGATMAYGDIGRSFTDHAHIFRSVLAIADRKNYADLKDKTLTTLQKIYKEEGGYNPTIEDQRLEWNNPLQLLWGVNIDAAVSDPGFPKYGTVKATHAGVVMQRNYSGTNDEQNGLMYYTGGGTYVHAHASGLDLEIYGAGYVIGPDFGGAASGYGSDLHEQYAVSYAAHNTIIVNGTSGRGAKTNGNSTWQNIVNPIVLEAVEPKPYANPIAVNFSFSTQFLDDKINNVNQQRTNSIIRTSATSGYYVDVFRSKSNTNNNFHDYLFHGLGDEMQIKTGENLLNLTASPTRYQNDVGDDRKQPGWRWFTDAKTSTVTNDAITARFDLQVTKDYLHLAVPGGVDKEYSTALAPPTQEVSNGYDKKDTQMFIMRKYGEAWNQPFIAIYEPSGNTESTIKSTENIIENNKVVGVKVISNVDGQEIIDYVLSNDDDVAINLTDLNIAFTGRFAVVRTISKANATDVSMYIGKGTQLTFLDKTINGDTENKAFTEFTLDSSLSVSNAEFNSEILVYPNPTKGNLKIKVPKYLIELAVNVYNIQGKLIKSNIEKVNNGNINLDFSSISKGIYFIKLNMDKPVFVKFIKN
ncbi:T9SS type A sorting domain-containing protein [uncultured Polaribacter sp.]|uniref:T9SS type A sorting domain-containing protein n=1 Tax=uncultured Polaribacter sp. TaxID=174711 RepID=UPI002607F266|nr:T9SS type A sorting domain-containing protein [uncultured Polaribacter sp.]